MRIKRKKKQIPKNHKGFSLMELLAVIVIISIISVLTIGTVSRYIKRAREEKINQNKKNLVLATELYLQSNENEYPKLIGDASIVKVNTLRKNNYLKEDVVNSEGEDCMEKSFVRVFKLDNDEYSYTTYLYCGDDEVPDEVEVPAPFISNFSFQGGKLTNGKFNDVKDAKFTFTIKGAEKDDTIGIYSYNYTIYVRSKDSEPFTEVFNSGNLKGGLSPTITVSSQKISSYVSLTGYTNVRVDITAINEQGGKLDYTKTSGSFEDQEPPECGATEGEAQDDDDWINKVTYGADGNIPTGQLRSYPGRVSVNCSDGMGSGCKRDRFTRSWPNNSKSISGIDYKLGTRWSYVLLEDNAKTANTTKCYVRANVDLQAPEVMVKVYRAKDKKLIKTVTAKDSSTIQAVMPEKTIASDEYQYVTGTSDEKWMNLENFGTDGIYIDVDIKDNLYLYSYEWKVNDAYIAGGTGDSIVASSASFENVTREGGTSATGVFPSIGLTDNPTNDAELKTAEHGALEGTIRGLKIVREGKRYGELKVCDKAMNCTTVHIYANIDVTPPLVPTTSYEKIKSQENYTPATKTDYQDHNHWSNEYVRAYIEGQREDKETRSSTKVTLSGWDHFTYYYEQQSGKENGKLTWSSPINNDIRSVLSGSNRYGFDIRAQGTHIVTFISCDRAGNCSSKSIEDYVKVDTVKPTCDIVTKYEENGKDITSSAKNTGSTNGSGWLKIGQQVTLSHSCEDEDNKFSSGCNETDFHNRQSYLFSSDINTGNAGANGYNTIYNSGDNTAGGHVVDYAGNRSEECPKMTVRIDHIAPKCQTNITWPEGAPLNPTNTSKPETGWLGLVNGTGPGKKTAKVSLICTDPTSTTGLMTGVHSTCDNDSKYDSHKYNQQYHIYDYEMSVTNAGAVDVGKGGKVIDIAGNETDCPANRTVKIDYTAPVCKTKIEYGIGAGASSFATNTGGNPKNGWLGWYTNTDTTKKMAKVSQVCTDPNGTQKSGCHGNMLFKVYDTELNVTNAGAVGVGDNGYVEDSAGNKTNCSTNGNWHTVKIDYTRPVCEVSISSTGSASNTGNSNEIVRNWVYSNYDGRWLGAGSKVTINSKCTSSENGEGTSSGCATNENKNYTSEIKTNNATTGGDGVDYFVYDKAGNRSASSCEKKKVQIDLTGPVCTIESRYGKTVSNTSPIYDANSTNYQGWLDGSYKVRVTSQCTGDNQKNGLTGSGCFETSIHSRDYSATSGSVLNTYGGAKSNGDGFTVYDAVGNSTFCGKKQIKIDAQAPTCSVKSKTNTGATYSGSWTNTDYVRVSRTCSDGSGSGCTTASQTDQHKDYSVSSGSVWTTTTGGAISTGNSGTISDNVGNITTCVANKTIRLDKQNPKCTVTSTNTGDWTNKNAVIQGKCDDFSGSGCKTTSAQLRETFSTDTNTTFEYNHTVYDNAGNSSKCPNTTYTIKVQKTKPECTTKKLNVNKPEGVDDMVTCTHKSNSAPLVQCAEMTSSYGMGSLMMTTAAEGYHTGLKSTKTYTVKDMAGNVNTCTTTVSSKYQNRTQTCSTCKRCSSASCEVYNSCRASVCGTESYEYWSSCAGYKYRGYYDSGGVCEPKGKGCGNGTSCTNCTYSCKKTGTRYQSCVNSSCTCNTRKRSCSSCGCESGLSGWSGWSDGSHSAGWDGSTNYERRVVYY